MSTRVVGVVAVIAAVLLVTVLLWRGCRSEPEVTPETIGDFEAGSVVLRSPELEVALLSVRGSDHAEYTDWAFVFECREAGGCRAELQLEVDYVSGGEKRLLGITGVVDADRGETMRIARIQRPAVAIDRIDRVTVAVVASHDSPTALPTPMQ
jgi:hypothetical protein